MAKNRAFGKTASSSNRQTITLADLGRQFGVHAETPVPTEGEKESSIYKNIRTPYNFIPFSDTVICRYGSLDEIPGHDKQDTGLLSGEIDVSVRAETPLLFRNPNGSEDFPKNSQGQYTIPGSSLRGLIRENMQILGYGAARPGFDVEDLRLSHRVPVPGGKKWQTQRVSYAHEVTDGLPESYRQEVLDYPDSILGFIGEQGAFRSRVSFGDLVAQGNVKQQPAIQLTLMEPKPSFCAAYVRANGNTIVDYDYPQFSLSGYKQYWLKESVWVPEPDPVSFQYKKKESENENVVTVSSSLPVGTELHSTIRYRNLYPDELGLLLGCLDLGLWRIHPEKECFQSLGSGKPYGFGRVVIRVRSLREYDISALYQSFSSSQRPADAPKARLEALLDAYLAQAGTFLSQGKQKRVELCGESRIQDFFFMKQKVWTDPEPVSYMSLDDFKDVNTPLPTVRKARTADRKQAK